MALLEYKPVNQQASCIAELNLALRDTCPERTTHWGGSMKKLDGVGEFLTIPEVCEILQLEYETVRRWIKAGKIKSIRVGRQHRICKTTLFEMMEKNNGI